MALDAIPTYPSEYDSTGVTNNPPGSDSRKQGDDQFRVLKANMNQTWANVAGAVTASHEEINRLVGVSLTNPIITLPSGTRATVNQDTAPPEWTIDAVPDEMVMRLTKGLAAGGLEGGTTGGANDFADQFQSHAEGAALGVGSHTLIEAETPAHTHGSVGNHTHQTYERFSTGGGNPSFDPGTTGIANQRTAVNNPDAAAGSHTHTSFGGSGGHGHTIDNAAKYSTFIVIVKD